MKGKSKGQGSASEVAKPVAHTGKATPQAWL